jgi:hypothetical protein
MVYHSHAGRRKMGSFHVVTATDSELQCERAIVSSHLLLLQEALVQFHKDANGTTGSPRFVWKMGQNCSCCVRFLLRQLAARSCCDGSTLYHPVSLDPPNPEAVAVVMHHLIRCDSLGLAEQRNVELRTPAHGERGRSERKKAGEVKSESTILQFEKKRRVPQSSYHQCRSQRLLSKNENMLNTRDFAFIYIYIFVILCASIYIIPPRTVQYGTTVVVPEVESHMFSKNPAPL